MMKARLTLTLTAFLVAVFSGAHVVRHSVTGNTDRFTLLFKKP